MTGERIDTRVGSGALKRCGATCCHSSASGPDAFEREAEMLWPLARQARELFGPRRAASREVEVYFEVAAASGIADMLVLRLDGDAIDARDRAGLGPLTSLTAARTVHAVRTRPLTVADLAGRVGVSESHLRRSVLPALSLSGHVTQEPPGWWVASAAVTPLLESSVAVEVKRRDWRRAYNQARRYRRWANVTYMALDARFARPALHRRAEISQSGIGVATVDAPTEVVQVWERPRWRAPLVGWEAFLVGERVWELTIAGKTAGPSFDVFGRAPDPTPGSSGTMPELAATTAAISRAAGEQVHHLR